MPRRPKKKTRDGPKKDFLDLYARCDEAGSRSIYLQKLSEVKDAIMRGNINSLKIICQSVYKIHSIEKEETLQKHYEHPDNPFFGTNFIIFTCRVNQYSILKYFLSSEESILKLYEKIGQKFIHPDNVDEHKHSAFYYAIRSNDVNMIEALTEYWPGYEFSQNKEKLEDLLSESYEELRLKNVDISPEMGIHVEKRLLDLRFFSETPNHDFWKLLSMRDIIARYDFLIEKIDEIANSEHSTDDMTFSYEVKFIAQNIHVLKRLLKSTSDSVPWEEVEFCLVVYLHTKSTNEELNLIFESFITIRKLVMHMQNFSKCLKSHRIHLFNKTVADVKKTPAIKRDNAIRRIIDKYPFFQELYNDYESCRDIHSLDTIRKYADLTKSANAEEKNGRLIIIRALQVLGEYTKNTLMSPKMSKTTGKRLLSNLGGNSRKVVAGIRNAVSHSFSLMKRTELEDTDGNSTFFVNIQNDLKRVNVVIIDILFSSVVAVIKKQLKKLVESEDDSEIMEILRTFRFVMEGFSLKPTNEVGNLEKLVSELFEKIPNPNITESYMIRNTQSIAESFKDAIVHSDRFIRAVSVLKAVEGFCGMINYSNNCTNIIRNLKFTANNLLKNLSTQTVQNGIGELNTRAISFKFRKSLDKLMDSVSSRLPEDVYNDLLWVVSEIINVVQFEMGNIGAIEDLWYELISHNAKFRFEDIPDQNESTPTRSAMCGRMVKKIEDLRNVMSSHKFSDSNVQSLLMLKDDKNTLAVIEMLSMDILSILGSPVMNRLNDNLFSIETYSPTLVGKSLRNYLAHGSDIALVNDPTTAVILNAAAFTLNDVIKHTALIGQLSWRDVNFLQKKGCTSAAIIRCQQQLFESLRVGDIEEIKLAISNGADITAKTADYMTALHFAAMCMREESLSYTLKQWKGTVNVRNSDGQNPFHIAAQQGNVKNLKLLWTRDKTLLKTDDKYGNTALHLAALAGHKDVINFLLALKASVTGTNHSGNTPLRLALFNSQVEASKILLKYYKPNSNPNGGFSPLHIAAEVGSVELVQFLLLQGENPKALTDRSATAMHLAALNGHTEVVKALIARGANVNAKSSVGGTPLLFAAETNREDIVRTLLESGADVNASTNNFSPIFHAAHNGNVKIAKLLLDKNAQVNLSFYPSGETPLHYAVGYGDNSEVTELLLRHKAIINAKDGQGSTSLHYAARCGHLASCVVLLNHGADASIVDQYGRSPIFYAAERGTEDIIKLLINARANINTEDIRGLTPLHLACSNGHTGVVKLLDNNGAVLNGNQTCDITPLQIVVLNGFDEIVDVLVSKGIKIDKMDKHGFTALHHAAATGNRNIITSLIKAGANVNTVQPTTGYTPLHIACCSGHTEASESLIQLGSSINAKGKNGHTPLQSVLALNTEQSCLLVKILIKNGAIVNTIILKQAIYSSSLDVVEFLLDNCHQISTNSDLLSIACIRHHNGILKALLKRGVNPNGKCNIGGEWWTTPLEFAATKGHEDVINLLIEHGANPNVQGFDGETSLHIIAGKGHLRAAMALLAHKADIMVEDVKRRTALDLAIANGHIDMVKMFIEHDKNIDVNRRAGNYGLPLLHVATQFGNLDLVKLLIKKGADINLRNSSGSKAIHFAAREGFPNMVEFFLSRKMDMYDRGVGGNTLLHYVAQGSGDGLLKVGDMLINRKHMNVNTPNDTGLTPLHLAVSISNDTLLIEFFLKNGAYFNSKSHLGIEPADTSSNLKVNFMFASIRKLFTAAKQGDLMNVNESIQGGAIVDAKNDNNDSPLLCAAWKGHEDIVNALLKNNANPNIVGKSGSTALHYAAKSANYNIIKSLLACGANFETLNDVGKLPMDYATSDNIITFFSLIRDSFIKVKSRNTTILRSLQRVNWKSDEVKALLNCTNNEGKTLISAAISADFPGQGIALIKKLFARKSRLERAEQLLLAERYQEALDIALSELDEGQLIFSRKSLMNTDVQIAMAKALYKLQRYTEAFNLFTDLYDTFREMIGDDNKQTLCMKMSIGLVLHREGRNEEALEIFKVVDEKQKVLLDPFDRQALETKSYIALALDQLCKIDEALEINYDVLEKLKRVNGSNHPSTLAVQNNIAMMLSNKGKRDEAIALWNHVYEQRKKVLGPNHADTMRTKSNIATAHIGLGNMNEAININSEALSNQESKLSSCDIDVLMSKMNRALALLQNGEFLGAMKLFQEVSKNKEHAGPGFASVESIFHQVSKVMNECGMVLTDDSTTDQYLTSLPNIPLPRMLSDTTGKSTKTRVKRDYDDIFKSLAEGDERIVEEMILAGVDLNIEDSEGRTPLHFAVSSGNKALVASCIRNGAKVNVKSKKGNTPLHTAALSGNEKIVRILLENVTKSEKNDFINAQTLAKEMTALHVASMKGSLKVVKLLLQNGANLEVNNKDCKTPLDLSTTQKITSYLTKFK